MRVTVDMFSGRPNPSFELDADEAEQVRRVLASLPPRPPGAAPVKPPGLGYRGFYIEGDDLGSVHVYGQSVVDGGGARLDEDRCLEQLVLRMARSHLGPDAIPEDWIGR